MPIPKARLKLKLKLGDIIIGASDGFTVPFALAAGMTGISGKSPHIVVIAGFSELVAGMVSMGVGGYLERKVETDTTMGEAITSGVTVGLGYGLAGFVTIAPYLFTGSVNSGLAWSVIVTLLALACFGYFKASVLKAPIWKSILETIVVGALAVGAAYLFTRLFGHLTK